MTISTDNLCEIIVESNMGDGMFTELFKPVINNIYPVSINEVRHHIQKEKRIVDTLEPVLNAHKLVVDPSVIRRDFQSAQGYPIEQQARYMLLYQLSRLTRERGALLQDDRLDALSIAVGYWVEQMAVNADSKINERKNELIEIELERFKNAAYKTSLTTQAAPTWL